MTYLPVKAKTSATLTKASLGRNKAIAIERLDRRGYVITTIIGMLIAFTAIVSASGFPRFVKRVAQGSKKNENT